MKRKETRDFIVVFIALMALITFLTILTIETIKTRKTCYKYYLNEEFGTSNNCVYKNDAYCEIGNIFEKVNYYYEVNI